MELRLFLLTVILRATTLIEVKSKELLLKRQRL